MAKPSGNPWDSRVLFVTGKGGVGKSTIAATIALRESRKGRKTLLVELGDESFYQGFFGISEPTQTPRNLAPGLDIARWDNESCLQEYVLHYLKVERIYRLFFENRVIRTLINVAPPLKELTLLGKITSGVRKIGPPLDYDLVVIDSFATGHTLALLRAPKGVGETIRMGPMGDQSRDIYKTILDPAICRYLIVTLADELPIAETVELHTILHNEMGLDPWIACNRLLMPPLTIQELDSLAESSKSETGVLDFVKYLLAVCKRQNTNLEKLSNFSPPFLFPLVTQARNGMALIEKLQEGFFG